MKERTMIGYHGLAREYVPSTISNQKFHISNKDNEWLGEGVYFWQYISDAVWWVSHDRFRDRETAILQALLTYTDEQLLDLDNPDERATLQRMIERVGNRFSSGGRTIALKKQADKKQQWCFACNVIRSLEPRIGIIIYTFPLREQKGMLFPANRKQICVSDYSIISDIKEAAI